jgi:hypothetical protein
MMCVCADEWSVVRSLTHHHEHIINARGDISTQDMGWPKPDLGVSILFACLLHSNKKLLLKIAQIKNGNLFCSGGV